MALVATWTDPVELSVNDVLTATTMNEQVFQNMMYLREPNSIVTKELTTASYNYTGTDWTIMTHTAISIDLPLGNLDLSVNIPYQYDAALSTEWTTYFAVGVNGTRYIAHQDTAIGTDDGLGTQYHAWSASIVLTGLIEGTNAINLQISHSRSAGATRVLGGSTYLSQVVARSF